MPAPASRPPVLNRLALRAAVPTAAAAAAAALVALAVADAPLALSLLLAAGVALVVGVAAFLVVQARVADRVELARRALREARKRRFDALADLPARSDRDELDALIRQVYRAGRTLQQEIERLETVESYRRDFLGDVSHELRTPIFAVAGFAETLLDGALDDDRVRRRFVEKILANARRLESLSRDLTAIAQLESGQMKLVPEPVGLDVLVAEVADSLELSAREAAVEVQVRLAPALPPVLADRDRLRQVLTNLVENAVKYNEAGGHVEVSARRLASGDVRLSVVDDGIGVPQEALPRLTERFFRVDRSRARARGGTGLGLAIVKHILEAHGARLSVESRPDYGSSFAFTLPAAPAPLAVAPRPAREPDARPARTRPPARRAGPLGP